MSEKIIAELTATCDALGYHDGKSYHLEKHCDDVIKDLIKYLRRDDPTHQVRRFLGQSNILQTDLLKIFIDHRDKTELWNVLIRLLINLTSPVLTVYNEQLPSEKVTRSYYLEMLGHLQQYKKAMANDKVWTVLSEHLGKLLAIESGERDENDTLLIERILTLIKNVLRIPPSTNDKMTDSGTNAHDELLFALNASGTTDLLLYIASNRSEEEYHMQILEIVMFMLHNQNPMVLAHVKMQRSIAEKAEDESVLMVAREREQKLKMEKMKKYAGSRHSRFGGTFVVQNMKAIGDNEFICHKPYQKVEDLDFSVTKHKVKKRVNKNKVAETVEEGMSPLSVRLFLKEFCVEFLNAAYNPLMRFAKSCINGGGQAVADPSCYLWALRFFMNFNRHYKFEIKYVSETISTEIFHLVQRQIEHHSEMMITDKKKIPYWSKRLHYAIKAYQELLNTLIEMDKSLDIGVKRSCKVIMSNIFYVQEYRETLLSQLLTYDEEKMSRSYLIDLVTTTHIFLKMLKNFCDKEKNVIVQKTKKYREKRSKKTKKPTAPEPEPLPSLEDRWDDIGPEVAAVMKEGEIPEVSPFDVLLETPLDEQKGDAMIRIQKFLRVKDFEQAIGLLRSAREVWHENDHFGRQNLSDTEEFAVLKEIFMADLGVPDEPVTTESNADEVEDLLNHEVDDEDDEEGDEPPVFAETGFKFMEFLQRFTNVKIVKALGTLLRTFDKNSNELNHYVLKMLHRIACECEMPAMIFQASIFRTFQRIFESKNPNHKDLVKFAKYIFNEFAKIAMKNPKAFMELLFWKNTRHCREMVDGYDSVSNTTKATRGAWTETEEDELRMVFMDHQTNKYSQDVVDYILSKLENKNRTRRGVMKKMKELYLIVNSKKVRNEVQKRLPKEWSEEEVGQLNELWENLKDDNDPVGLIFEGLRIKRPKAKIKAKLLELGLAEDLKQLRKKRAKKSDGERKGKKRTKKSGAGSNDERSGGDSSDENSDKDSGSDSDKDSDKDSDDDSDRGNNRKSSDESDDDVLENLKKFFKKNQPENESMPSTSNLENATPSETNEPPEENQDKSIHKSGATKKMSQEGKNKKSGKVSRIQKMMDSDSEEEIERGIENEESRTPSVSKENSTPIEINEHVDKVKKKSYDKNKGSKKSEEASNKSSRKTSRIQKVVDSDSEDEMDRELGDEDEQKRGRSDNSDTETPVSKKRRLIDSDDEDNVDTSTVKKTRELIQSDGENDDTSELSLTAATQESRRAQMSDDEGGADTDKMENSIKRKKAVLFSDSEDEEMPGTEENREVGKTRTAADDEQKDDTETNNKRRKRIMAIDSEDEEDNPVTETENLSVKLQFSSNKLDDIVHASNEIDANDDTPQESLKMQIDSDHDSEEETQQRKKNQVTNNYNEKDKLSNNGADENDVLEQSANSKDSVVEGGDDDDNRQTVKETRSDDPKSTRIEVNSTQVKLVETAMTVDSNDIAEKSIAIEKLETSITAQIITENEDEDNDLPVTNTPKTKKRAIIDSDEDD